MVFFHEILEIVYSMAWRTNDTVHFHTGTVRSNNVAAFDFDQTLAWSDSGLTFMRTEDDWVPTSSTLPNIFAKLVNDYWTIVIFTNQLENNPEFTRKALARMSNFFNQLNQLAGWTINPYMYVAIRDDENRKPRRGMWDMFIEDTQLVPSGASFYCGDAFAPAAENPLYRWGDYDFNFAHNCNLAYYTPEEIVGTYVPPALHPEFRVYLIMAAHTSQYQDFLISLLGNNPNFTVGSLNQTNNLLAQGRDVVVVGERFAKFAGRRRAMHMINREYHGQVVVLMFTRPVRPFINQADIAAVDNEIRGYANVLDVHPQFETIYTTRNEPFPIVRIN